MKHTIGLLFICLFAGVFTTQAQGNHRTVEERVKATLEKITPALNLDNSQATVADSAYTTYYKEMQKLRGNMQSGTKPDMTEFKKLAAERDEKLKKTFTADQYKKFKDEVEPSLRPKRKGNGQQMQGNHKHKDKTQ